eukprot:scaffold37061_cov183-Skeletonema_dohrnii-CCMP3373.AAC.3
MQDSPVRQKDCGIVVTLRVRPRIGLHEIREHQSPILYPEPPIHIPLFVRRDFSLSSLSGGMTAETEQDQTECAERSSELNELSGVLTRRDRMELGMSS